MDDSNSGGMGFLALLLFILILGSGTCGGALWGNGANAAAQTAAMTADTMANRQISADLQGVSVAVANNGSAINYALRGIDDLQARADVLNTSLCQLGNSLSQQINQVKMETMGQFCSLSHQLADCCCATKQAVADSEARIVGLINANRMEDLKTRISALEQQNRDLTLAASQNQQTCEIIAAVRNNGCAQAPAYAYGYGYGWPGYACCYPCNPCNPCAVANNVDAINTSLQTANTTLNSILAKIPTTTTTTPAA